MGQLFSSCKCVWVERNRRGSDREEESGIELIRDGAALKVFWSCKASVHALTYFISHREPVLRLPPWIWRNPLILSSMALYLSSYKSNSRRCVILRQRLLEQGADSPDFPQSHADTIVYHYWKQKEAGGMLRSIIHPDIRSAIVCPHPLVDPRLRVSRQRSSAGIISFRTMHFPHPFLTHSSCSSPHRRCENGSPLTPSPRLSPSRSVCWESFLFPPLPSAPLPVQHDPQAQPRRLLSPPFP